MFRGPADKLGYPVDRSVLTGSDVDDLSFAYPFACGGEDIGADDVADMGEIARLLAVAGYGHRATLKALLDEFCNYKRIGALCRSARTVYIEVAQTGRRQPIYIPEEPAVEFTRVLLQTVGANRVRR